MYPDKTEVSHMAEYVKTWTFRRLIHTTDLTRPFAMACAMLAAERYAQALEFAISEGYHSRQEETAAPALPDPRTAADIRPDLGAVKSRLDVAINRDANTPPTRARRPQKGVK